MRFATLALVLCSACGTPPIVRDDERASANHNPPLGRIEGTVIYDGPPPAVDAAGRPVGRVVLLLFRADAPPPPQGFATTALSVATLPATQLFASLSPSAPGRVRASAAFTFPGVTEAGTFQLRAFYSTRDDERGFHPIYGTRNQPWRGDVAGGALLDANAANPVFQRIAVGRPGANGGLELPQEGAVTSGVTVVIGSPVETDRPVFHVSLEGGSLTPARIEAPPSPGEAFAAWASRTSLLAPTAGDPLTTQTTRALVLPSNVASADPAGLLNALPSLTLVAGLPTSELPGAARAGVVFSNPPPLLVGTPFQSMHPTLFGLTAAGVVRPPWVFPLVMLVRLRDPEGPSRVALASTARDPALFQRAAAEIAAPASPPLVIFGSVLPAGGVAELPSLLRVPPAAPEPYASARVVFPPVAFEIRGADPTRQWSAIVPRLPAAIAQAVAGSFPPGSRCSASGLPAGRYALTVVTARGQSWSLPNELAPSALSAGFAVSQGVVVRVERSAPVAGTECPAGLPAGA